MSKEAVKFSIITVTLNPGKALEKTVSSIESQTYDNYEVIIKDGGSTDGSISEVSEKNNGKIKVISEKDTGLYDAMNQAVKYATGDFLIFMNAGDCFFSESVLADVAAGSSVAENTIVYGDAYFCDTETVFKPIPRITAFSCYRNFPCHQSIFYSKDVLCKKNYDTSFRIRADYEHFLYSFFKAESKFVYVGFPICRYEGGGVSEKKENIALSQKEYKTAVRRYISAPRRFLYRAALILSLYKVRGYLSHSKTFAGIYSKAVSVVYGMIRK